jgi:hypothetical protein
LVGSQADRLVVALLRYNVSAFCVYHKFLPAVVLVVGVVVGVEVVVVVGGWG